MQRPEGPASLPLSPCHYLAPSLSCSDGRVSLGKATHRQWALLQAAQCGSKVPQRDSTFPKGKRQVGVLVGRREERANLKSYVEVEARVGA